MTLNKILADHATWLKDMFSKLKHRLFLYLLKNIIKYDDFNFALRYKFKQDFRYLYFTIAKHADCRPKTKDGYSIRYDYEEI